MTDKTTSVYPNHVFQQCQHTPPSKSRSLPNISNSSPKSKSPSLCCASGHRWRRLIGRCGGVRHDVEEWQETVPTRLINRAALPADESARFASMSRPEIAVTEKWSRQLNEFAKTGPQTN
jgi:hypothetical protein